MEIPFILDRATLAELAAPNETHAVRLIITKVSNSGVFRFRCKSRQYLFERDGVVGAHILDIPVSVFMHGTENGLHGGGASISQDLQPTIHTPFFIQVVPWGEPAPAVVVDEAALIPLLGQFLEKLSPPPEMLKALELMKAGDVGAFRQFVEAYEEGDTEEEEQPPVEQPAAPAAPAGPSPAAIRQKAYRERKKAEAAARKAQKAQAKAARLAKKAAKKKPANA